MTTDIFKWSRLEETAKKLNKSSGDLYLADDTERVLDWMCGTAPKHDDEEDVKQFNLVIVQYDDKIGEYTPLKINESDYDFTAVRFELNHGQQDHQLEHIGKGTVTKTGSAWL